MSVWAIDLGSTNTGIATWDEAEDRPRLIELEHICREAGGEDPLAAPRLVPSVVEFLLHPNFLARLSRGRVLGRRFYLGRTARIGRQALESSAGLARPNFVPEFKSDLQRDALRVLGRAGRRSFTAREVARQFLRELLHEVRQQTGERVKQPVFTVPVESYETYRAELTRISHTLGLRKVRFLDEPVAAALGYGLGLTQERRLLVVDHGGSTLHLALVALSARGIEQGKAEVLAKEGRPLGGKVIDDWILRRVCEEGGFSPEGVLTAEDDPGYWRRLMRAEACRVKEALFFQTSANFRVLPPGVPGDAADRIGGSVPLPELTRDALVEILRKGGLYQSLEECLAGLWQQSGLGSEAIDEVVMVGGSTLLPGEYPFFEERFGRARMRAWQPFEAVAFGAAAFAADRFRPADFIVHDYAFITHDPETHEVVYNPIIPRGTRFPTPSDFWKRRVVPTCSMGEPETFFKLVVAEIGRDGGGDRRFAWDAEGNLRRLGGKDGDEKPHTDRPWVVPLNAENPTLGHLDPPHPPGERRPRLEVSFGVNEERWLCATVVDLYNGKVLMKERPVVKLL